MARKRLNRALALLSLPALLACSSSSPDGDPGTGSGSDSGDAMSGGMGAGGAGPGSGPDSSGAGAGQACAAVAETANNDIGPADVIMAIDQSGSMTDETLFVQENINTLAAKIEQSGVDIYLALIAEQPAGTDFADDHPSCLEEDGEDQNKIWCLPRWAARTAPTKGHATRA